MKKIFTIAKWEYIEKVRTKTFIISMFLTPAILLVFSLAPTWFSRNAEESTRAYGIIDSSEIYYRPLKTNLEEVQLKSGQPKFVVINLFKKNDYFPDIKKSADNDVVRNKLEGYILILNGGSNKIKIEFRSRGSGSFEDINKIEEIFNKVKNKLLLQNSGVDSSVINSAMKYVQVEPIKIEVNGKESKADFLTLFFSSFIFIMLLMMMVLSTGNMLVRSLLEEKSNRLIEILISSCTQKELLAGKVIALSGLGFTQILIWSTLGLLSAGTALVPINVFENIVPMMIYFMLGYVFYVSIFVGIGSICSTEQEAQQITSYISIVLTMPVIFSLSAIEYPGSLLVRVLSYIPFTTASIMILRVKIESIQPWEYVSTTMIMIISIYLVVAVSAKLFKIGILSYGKRPTFKELIRWIREK